MVARCRLQHPDVFRTDHHRRDHNKRAEPDGIDETRDALPQHVSLPIVARHGRLRGHVLRVVPSVVRVGRHHTAVGVLHRRLLQVRQLPQRRRKGLLQLVDRVSHAGASHHGGEPVRRTPSVHRGEGAYHHHRAVPVHLHPALPPLLLQRRPEAHLVGVLGRSRVESGADHRRHRRVRRRLRRRRRRLRPQHQSRAADLRQEDPASGCRSAPWRWGATATSHSHAPHHRRGVHRVRDAAHDHVVPLQVRPSDRRHAHRVERLLRPVGHQPRVELRRVHLVLASLSIDHARHAAKEAGRAKGEDDQRLAGQTGRHRTLGNVQLRVRNNSCT